METSTLGPPFGGTEDEKEVQQKYRNLFKTPEGEDVLSHLLTMLHYFDEIVNEDDRVLRNFAITLLDILGIAEVMKPRKFVETFLRIPLTGE